MIISSGKILTLSFNYLISSIFPSIYVSHPFYKSPFMNPDRILLECGKTWNKRFLSVLSEFFRIDVILFLK